MDRSKAMGNIAAYSIINVRFKFFELNRLKYSKMGFTIILIRSGGTGRTPNVNLDKWNPVNWSIAEGKPGHDNLTHGGETQKRGSVKIRVAGQW
jgi:hypothetical protein